MVLKCCQVFPRLKYTRWKKRTEKLLSHTHTDLCVNKEIYFSLIYSVTKEMYYVILIIGIQRKCQPKVLLKSVTFGTFTKLSTIVALNKKFMNLMIFEIISYTTKLDMNNSDLI